VFREDIEKRSRAGSNIELVVPMNFRCNSNVVAMTTSPIIWPNDIGFSSEFLGVLDVAKDGGSTILECLETAQRIVPGDEESWFAQWDLTAKESMRRADIAAIGKRSTTASANWLRAANYFRVAQIFLESDDPRRKHIIEQMRRCARRHLTSTVPSGETVKIPYMSGSIEGCLYWAAKRLSRASMVICLGGEDDFKEATRQLLPNSGSFSNSGSLFQVLDSKLLAAAANHAWSSVTQACAPPLIGITFLGSSQWSIRSAQCCISFVREPISASGPCFL
jgi:hypothetical protein